MAIISTACSTSTEQHKPTALDEIKPSSFQALLRSQENMEYWKVTLTPTSIANQVKIKVEAIYLGENQISEPSMTAGGATVSSLSMEPNTGFSTSNVNLSKEIRDFEVKLSWIDNNEMQNGKAIFSVSIVE